MSLPHSALAPSGQPIWLDMARRSARALWNMRSRGIKLRDILTDAAVRNAMVVHAAFGGSTNLLLHIPAIAHAAGLRRPTVEDWQRINLQVPRLVDALPNGPVGHPTVQVFLAGGVPEVMLHLRELGLARAGRSHRGRRHARRVAGLVAEQRPAHRLAANADRSRRSRSRRRDHVPARAREKGLTSTVCFPRGNLAPQGSVVKSTAISPKVLDAAGVYRKLGPARVFTREVDAIAAIKGRGEHPIKPGDVLVLAGRGPLGSGMEEIYQITAALKHLSWGHEVTVVTDARFSGVSTGACIGHVGPEALAGGPLGKLRDGDMIQIMIDCQNLVGTVDFVGDENGRARSGSRSRGAGRAPAA